jgi:hypothetical protein
VGQRASALNVLLRRGSEGFAPIRCIIQEFRSAKNLRHFL